MRDTVYKTTKSLLLSLLCTTSPRPNSSLSARVRPPLSKLERGKANRKIANRRLGRGEVELIKDYAGITLGLLHSQIGIRCFSSTGPVWGFEPQANWCLSAQRLSA